MRDEVLAEWKGTDDGPALHVYCHVSGGLFLDLLHYDVKSFGVLITTSGS